MFIVGLLSLCEPYDHRFTFCFTCVNGIFSWIFADFSRAVFCSDVWELDAVDVLLRFLFGNYLGKCRLRTGLIGVWRDPRLCPWPGIDEGIPQAQCPVFPKPSACGGKVRCSLCSSGKEQAQREASARPTARLPFPFPSHSPLFPVFWSENYVFFSFCHCQAK